MKSGTALSTGGGYGQSAGGNINVLLATSLYIFMNRFTI